AGESYQLVTTLAGIAELLEFSGHRGSIAQHSLPLERLLDERFTKRRDRELRGRGIGVTWDAIVRERSRQLSADAPAETRKGSTEAGAAYEQMGQWQIRTVVMSRHHGEVGPCGVEVASEHELPALVVRRRAGIYAVDDCTSRRPVVEEQVNVRAAYR